MPWQGVKLSGLAAAEDLPARRPETAWRLHLAELRHRLEGHGIAIYNLQLTFLIHLALPL